MKLIILSDLVGIPGDEFHPSEGTNIEALIEGGFIKETKTPTSKAEEN